MEVIYKVNTQMDAPPKTLVIPKEILAKAELGKYAIVITYDNSKTAVEVKGTDRNSFVTRGGNIVVDVWLDPYTMELLGLDDGEIVGIGPAIVRTGEVVRVRPDRKLTGEEKRLVREKLLGKVISVDDIIPLKVGDEPVTITVTRTQPIADGVVVGLDTNIVFEKASISKGGLVLDVSFEDIGGYDDVKKKVRDYIIRPLTNPEHYEATGFIPPKGVLLTGPAGVGKTMFIKAIARGVDAELVYASAVDILSDSYYESKERLEDLFNRAVDNAPALLCIEDIDLIAPKEGAGDVEKKLSAALQYQMDKLNTPGVVVVGTSSQPDGIAPSLKRAGRFDREIEIPVPDVHTRAEILKALTRSTGLGVSFDYKSIKGILEELGKEEILEELSPAMKPENIEQFLKKKFPDIYENVREKLAEEFLLDIARKTHGFVGADLEVLVREATLRALKRVHDFGGDGRLTKADFEEVRKYVEPSALKEVLVEVPEVHWEDIGGYEEVKKKLQEVVEWPLSRPQLFEATGIDPPKGVLLYGPPGTGKTLLAKAVATESGANFIAIKGPEILSKWVGESERRIREVFRKARQVAPTVVFIDEIDSIGQKRGSEKMQHVDSIINQLLTEMDGLEERGKVVVLAATNRPDILDPALLRPGRFDRLILVPAPDEKARLEILRVHTKRIPVDDIDLENLAKKTEGYSGADLEALVREATMNAIRRALPVMKKDMSLEKIREVVKVTQRDFEEAMKIIKPSITKSVEQYYAHLEKNLKNLVGRSFEKEYGRFW